MLLDKSGLEDFAVRRIRLIMAVLSVVGVLGGWCLGAAWDDANTEGPAPNKLVTYYGFEEMEIIKLEWGIRGLRIADFNGDGRNDIAIVNNRKAKIELLIQKEAIGPGETEVAVDPEDVDINTIIVPTRFDKQAVAVSQEVYGFVCGDLNSDGMMDLAFYGKPRGLYVILQKAGEAEKGKSGQLSWRTRKKIEIDDGLVTNTGLACADLNNDGADDLVLAGRDGVYIILQKEGVLAEPVKYPETAQILGVEVGDLNGDGVNDLVLVTNDTENPIHVRFGLETGRLGPQVQFFIERPLVLKLYDIDGAHGDEILTIDARSSRLICYGHTSEEESEDDWPILFYPLASGPESTKRDLVVGDFDGDGLDDVVVSDGGAAELVFYRQAAGLGLEEPVRFPAFSDITGMSAADIDGDGASEIGVLSVKEKLIGVSEFKDERLSFPQPVEVVGEPVGMGLADVDRDGSVDCVYVSKDSNDVRSLRVIYTLAAAGDRGAKLTKKEKKRLKISGKAGEVAPAVELKELASNPDGLRIVDVDQDGLEDVLIFVKYDAPVLVRQIRKREFEVVDSRGTQASLIKDVSLRSVAVADVDGKVGEELLVAQGNFARSLVFAAGKVWSIIDQYNARGTENRVSAVAAFDIGGMGFQAGPAILLLDGQKGQLQILKAGEDKTYRFEQQLDVGTWNSVEHLKMLFAPLTGDGVRNILLFDSDKFALITPPGEGAVHEHLETRFSYETEIKDGAYGRLAGGDINSDGRADIVMVEYKHNHIEILALDGQMKPIPAVRFKIFEKKGYGGSKRRAKTGVEPRELEVADVTGDGKADLVTVIHDRIIIYPQD